MHEQLNPISVVQFNARKCTNTHKCAQFGLFICSKFTIQWKHVVSTKASRKIRSYQICLAGKSFPKTLSKSRMLCALSIQINILMAMKMMILMLKNQLVSLSLQCITYFSLQIYWPGHTNQLLKRHWITYYSFKSVVLTYARIH